MNLLYNPQNHLPNSELDISICQIIEENILVHGLINPFNPYSSFNSAHEMSNIDSSILDENWNPDFFFGMNEIHKFNMKSSDLNEIDKENIFNGNNTVRIVDCLNNIHGAIVTENVCILQQDGFSDFLNAYNNDRYYERFSLFLCIVHYINNIYIYITTLFSIYHSILFSRAFKYNEENGEIQFEFRKEIDDGINDKFKIIDGSIYIKVFDLSNNHTYHLYNEVYNFIPIFKFDNICNFFQNLNLSYVMNIQIIKRQIKKLSNIDIICYNFKNEELFRNYYWVVEDSYCFNIFVPALDISLDTLKDLLIYFPLNSGPIQNKNFIQKEYEDKFAIKVHIMELD